MRPQPDAPAIFQPDGAVIFARRSIEVQVELAVAAGAIVHEQEKCVALSPQGDGVRAFTRRRRIDADVAVVCAGPWSLPLLAPLGLRLPLQAGLAQVTSFRSLYRAGSSGPGLMERTHGDGVYGMPEPGKGFKLGWATINPMTFWKVVEGAALTTAPNELALVERVREDFPGFDPTPLRHEAGPITLVPDELFVIDRRGPIVVGAACIGHAFKFSPALGELFADLAEQRPLPPEARRFRLDRPTLAPERRQRAASPSAPDPRARAPRRGVQSALTARGGRMAEQDGERLGTGNLTLPDVVAQSVGYMGPAFSGTFFIPTIVGLGFAGHGAGIASPFAILLTAIGMLALAWIISRYAKRIHAAGALYDYVREGFGRATGLFAGWVYYGGALMLTLAIGLAFGGFLSLTLAGVHGIDINWIWCTLAFWIVAWAISVLGVQISTRAQLVLALVSIAVIFAWAIYVILKGGSDGFSAEPVQSRRVQLHGHHLRHRLRRADLRRLRVGGEPGGGDGRAEAQHPARDLLQRDRWRASST